jgi:hypothetical protein
MLADAVAAHRPFWPLRSRIPIMRKEALGLFSFLTSVIWIGAAPPRCGAG